MQKTIRIQFVGFYPEFRPEWCTFYSILQKHYDVQIVDQDPEYVICSAFLPSPYAYCRYPQVRIMDCGENYIPDFNLVDYAVSRYPISLYDRNFYYPGCACFSARWLGIARKDRNYSPDILKEKTCFANFIASHESEYGLRGDFFKQLCKYKRVESPGTYLNNVGSGVAFTWATDEKIDFQKKCKFTLCFESTSHYGFITEKIADAFYSDTIPVYYGSPNVKEIFNEKAFINVADYGSFDEVIEKIKELDRDDEKYLEMLRQPVFVNPDYPEQLLEDMEKFVCHIFDQPVEQAFRRSRVYLPQRINDKLISLMDLDENTFTWKFMKMIRPMGLIGKKVIHRLKTGVLSRR